ncbi:MAG: nickel pincer cofactor biosynthesis protein LarB [Candidatus Omnitrophica bacterium]|nr:nickel pincer cofactor biosynthesis protein LarB [Candidatus Omnitrophota bacterium]MDD5653657.1 nickel pincer cofactor biosynthesis protein LarB [Candidatus Omnitrophota bacterium]
MPSKKGFCDLGFAKIDTDRFARRGFSEAVYCPGKDRQHLKNICRQFILQKQDLLLTKLEKNIFTYLKKAIPRLKYFPKAKIAFLKAGPVIAPKGLVVVISAGTSDIAVAEEAAVTSELMGNSVTRLYDVGVAGVHRVMHHLDLIKKAKVIIVVAGMEGALASLVSGLVKSPIVAVPTSCGYGSSFQGLSALLTMLNSCSPGITVVNIDNGFGAGYFASLINK